MSLDEIFNVVDELGPAKVVHVSEPTLGSDVIFTDCNMLPASTSLNGKSAEPNVKAVSSDVVTELVDVVGVTLKLMSCRLTYCSVGFANCPD